MILARLSDPHMRTGEGGAGAVASPEAGVRAVPALRPHPDAVLVSGDLADIAAAEEYRIVRDALARLPMPVHVLGGNHDDRDALREWFPLADGEEAAGGRAGGGGASAGAEYRYVADVAGTRLVVCDSPNRRRSRCTSSSTAP